MTRPTSSDLPGQNTKSDGHNPKINTLQRQLQCDQNFEPNEHSPRAERRLRRRDTVFGTKVQEQAPEQALEQQRDPTHWAYKAIQSIRDISRDTLENNHISPAHLLIALAAIVTLSNVRTIIELAADFCKKVNYHFLSSQL